MALSIRDLRRNTLLNIKNFPGPTVNRKFLVIECDDYGGIRTPSREVYDILVNKGLTDSDDRYRVDTLATVEDMEQLFSTLEGVKDINGNCGVMTPKFNVANPDFDKIRQSGFTKYYFEKCTDTLLRYGRGPEVYEKWKQGLEKGIFIPEFHGREHISVQLWMQKLREGNPDLMLAFDHEYVSLKMEEVPSAARGFRPEFFFTSADQLPFLKDSIASGVELFKELFGYAPRAFVPSNAIFHPDLEQSVVESGVKFLSVWHMNPIPRKDGSIRTKYYRNGKKGSSGLTSYVRNCAFEPTDRGYGGIDSTLKQINAAFKWRKPAIISTHRANFVGGIEPSNRASGLQELSKLLAAIIKRWPDVEFLSSSDMLKILYPDS